MNVTTAGLSQSADRLAGLERLFQAAPVGLCLIDLAYRYVMVNEAFARMYDLPASHFTGKSIQDALPSLAEQVMTNLRRSVELSSPVESEISYEHSGPQGEVEHRVYLRSAQPLFAMDGALTGFSVALSDITERKQIEAALRESEADYRHTVDLNPHIPWTTDAQGQTLYASPRYLELTGLTPDQARVHGWTDQIHPADRASAWEDWCCSLETGVPYDQTYRLQTVTGDWRWVRARAFPRYDQDGSIVRWYGTLEDVHERKQLDEALRTKTVHLEKALEQLGLLAREDHLTGLANRRHFDDCLAQELAHATRSAQPLALLLIDVDHFKLFNDAYGHIAGDQALQTVARVLREGLRRRGDLAARYGGEEFVLLLPDTGGSGALQVADQALRAVQGLRLPHAAAPTGLLTISVGVAVFDASQVWNGASAVHDLVQSADFALYAAKNGGRNRVVSSFAMRLAPETSLVS